MTSNHSGLRKHVAVASLKKKVPTRWVVATLVLVVAALAVRLTVLDDTWLRVLLAGGDRIGMLAKDRQSRMEKERAENALPAPEVSGPASKTSP